MVRGKSSIPRGDRGGGAVTKDASPNGVGFISDGNSNVVARSSGIVLKSPGPSFACNFRAELACGSVSLSTSFGKICKGSLLGDGLHCRTVPTGGSSGGVHGRICTGV